MVFAAFLRLMLVQACLLAAWLCMAMGLPAQAQTMMNANINGLYLGGHWGAGVGVAGATTTTGSEGVNSDTSTIANSSDGSTWKSSIRRDRAVSTQPPK